MTTKESMERARALACVGGCIPRYARAGHHNNACDKRTKKIAAALDAAEARGLAAGSSIRLGVSVAELQAQARAEGERSGREAVENSIEVLANLWEKRGLHNKSVHWLEHAKDLRALVALQRGGREEP